MRTMGIGKNRARSGLEPCLNRKQGVWARRDLLCTAAMKAVTLACRRKRAEPCGMASSGRSNAETVGAELFAAPGSLGPTERCESEAAEVDPPVVFADGTEVFAGLFPTGACILLECCRNGNGRQLH